MDKNLKEFDIANYLDNNELIASYLNEILKDGNMDEFFEALNDIARAKGISKNSFQDSLDKPLKANSHPRFDTVLKVLDSVGIKLKAIA